MIDYKDLIDKHGSPLYIYNLDEVSNAYEKLVASLPDDSILYYSLKANPNPEVTKHLVNLGCYAEVSSIGELNTALDVGTHPDNCIYTGPGKTRKEIKYALSKNINHFSVESVEELIIIDELASELSKAVNITLRINPAFTVGKASIKMTGIPSQFGFDEESIDANVIQLITKNQNLKINGFHIYNGSNFHSVEMIEENFMNTLNTVINLQEKLSLEPEFIDFGGGFAAPFGKNESLPSYEKLKERLTKLLRDKFKGTKSPKIAFESGRYLTATCGTLVGTVQSVKMSKGKKYCIVDFGINHIGGMSGLRRIPTVELQLFKLTSSENDTLIMDNVNIVGPLCTPLDYLAKNVSLGAIEPGDIVFISNVGAYGLTGSLLGFLSREIPNELIIKNQELLCVHTIELTREVTAKI
ncbi:MULTISPECIES: decarboxylase [Bacillus cereus group]|uniref:decarboxylase n=1 Tax=Bacillus cereus group TaxID=86661 RepID=UPI0001A1C6AD|nr:MULTISPECIES: decarboxylase [Bacillus cereus group]EEM69062.1 Decarboxylase [Bacillus thuringiensis serovar andalousiensis BGSC 4AW1]MEB9627239.1 decarboxylase [Bacillus anthracis]OUA98261.1 decarboxylase [Bacillus thuringiensis serovar oswaldocruzi]